MGAFMPEARARHDERLEFVFGLFQRSAAISSPAQQYPRAANSRTCAPSAGP